MCIIDVCMCAYCFVLINYLLFSVVFVEKKQFMSHYVGVHGHSYDSWNHYVFARLLGETVVEATGNKTLCENLGKNDTVSDVW